MTTKKGKTDDIKDSSIALNEAAAELTAAAAAIAGKTGADLTKAARRLAIAQERKVQAAVALAAAKARP